MGFGMGVCDGTKYQAKLAYYESACFTHNFFFFFFPQQGLKLRFHGSPEVPEVPKCGNLKVLKIIGQKDPVGLLLALFNALSGELLPAG